MDMAEERSGPSPPHSEAPMHPRDRSFSIWITIFGTLFGYGIYSLIAKQYTWGGILTLIGFGGLLTSPFLAGSSEPGRFWLMLCALILTWVAIVYQVWLSRNSPAAENVTKSADISISPLPTYFRHADAPVGYNERWLPVRLTNNGSQAASCRLWIMNVSHDWVSYLGGVSLEAWADNSHHPSPLSGPAFISPGHHYDFVVAFVNDDNQSKEFQFAGATVSQTYRKLISNPEKLFADGSYSFQVQPTGDNCSSKEPLSLNVDYGFPLKLAD
jgi:hypothetical protein